MPIPYRDVDTDLEDLGLAGFLKVTAGAPGVWRVGLLVVNALGEPVEFTHNRGWAIPTFLWFADGPARRLLSSVFDACVSSPGVVLIPQDESRGRILDRLLAIPVARITPGAFSWLGDAPSPESAAVRLVERLRATDLLTEPFERVAAALASVERAEA